jgi:hypothetical protein
MPTLKPEYRVMWDWEITNFDVDRPDKMPAVFRCGDIDNNLNGHYTRLTKEWQFFWFDLCCKVYYGRYHQDLTKEEYRWLANRWTAVGANKRAFTNLHGVDKFRNYVLKERLDKEDPKIYTLVCGGASLAGTPVPIQKGNKTVWMLKVAYFDGTKPPPPVETIDPYTDPRVFFATTITSKKIVHEYEVTTFNVETNPLTREPRKFPSGFSVNPFPQFMKDGVALDCPVPLIASKDIYYPLKDLAAIKTGQKPSPYFPPREISP